MENRVLHDNKRPVGLMIQSLIATLTLKSQKQAHYDCVYETYGTL